MGFGFQFYQYGTLNTFAVKSGIDDKYYNVHQAHEDHEKAADLMAQVSSRINKFLTYLKNKYKPSEGIIKDMNREKNNHIDVIPITSDENNSYEKVERLIRNYKPNRVFENSPLNIENSTSYTEGKGKKLAICLRHKKTLQFHDINIIMFVVVHELAHLANAKYGHHDEFWRTFGWLLREAVEAGVYKPVNYRINPIVYCGLRLDFNPLFSNAPIFR